MTINTNGYVYFSTKYQIKALPYDLDTRIYGGIYYQSMNVSSNDFSSVKSEFSTLCNDFLSPTNIFRITYLGVPDYSSDSLIASFQIILATDSLKSFVLLKYTSCLSETTSFTSTPGLYHQDTSGVSKTIELGAPPCSSSNVNLTGTWIYDVTGKTCAEFFFLLKVLVEYIV